MNRLLSLFRPLRGVPRAVARGLELEELVPESVFLVLLVGTMVALAERAPY